MTCKEIELKEKTKTVIGSTSRTKGALIEQAIKRCSEEEKNNINCICEKLSEILIEKFLLKNTRVEDLPKDFDIESISDKTLKYQTKRMGFISTKFMIKEIENHLINKYK